MRAQDSCASTSIMVTAITRRSNAVAPLLAIAFYAQTKFPSRGKNLEKCRSSKSLDGAQTSNVVAATLSETSNAKSVKFPKSSFIAKLCGIRVD